MRKNRNWCNFGNAVAYTPQFWNWLEDKRSEYDEVPREVWKAVKTKAEKIRVVKIKERRKERGKAKEMLW